MATSFSIQVADYAKKYNALMEAAYKEAVQETIIEAQNPVAKGGKMRVLTGFLRNSGTAKIGGMPSGSGYNEGATIVVLSRAKPNDKIYFGWSANYAIWREYKDGFMRSAAQNWEQHVSRAVEKARKAVRK